MQEGATLSRTGRRRRARGRRVRADARRSTPRSASILRRRRRRAPRRRWPPGSRAVRRDDAGQAFGETFDPRQGAIGEHFLTLYSSGGTVSARFAQQSLRSLLSRRRRHRAALHSSSPRFSGTKGLLFSVFGTMVPYLKPHVKPLDLRSNAKTLATAAPAKRGRALSVGSRLRRVWAAPASGERPRRPKPARDHLTDQKVAQPERTPRAGTAANRGGSRNANALPPFAGASLSNAPAWLTPPRGAPFSAPFGRRLRGEPNGGAIGGRGRSGKRADDIPCIPNGKVYGIYVPFLALAIGHLDADEEKNHEPPIIEA
jgi:hypothetical protein